MSEFATSSGYSEVAEPYWARLLLYRLETGPDPVWDPTEENLLAALRSSRFVIQDRATLNGIVRALEAEDWGDEGKNLRVRTRIGLFSFCARLMYISRQALCEAYLVLSVPNLDEETLRTFNAVLDTDTRAPLYQTFLVTSRNRLQGLAPGPSTRHLIQPSPASHRLNVREAVQAIIEPSPLEWMDDDDQTFDAQYVHRSLNEISNRFERQ